MGIELTGDQQIVLNFLDLNKNNGKYSAKDIHESVFGRVKSIKRFAFNKTSNILRALVNRGLVHVRFDGDRNMYQPKTQFREMEE